MSDRPDDGVYADARVFFGRKMSSWWDITSSFTLFPHVSRSLQISFFIETNDIDLNIIVSFRSGSIDSQEECEGRAARPCPPNLDRMMCDWYSFLSQQSNLVVSSVAFLSHGQSSLLCGSLPVRFWFGNLPEGAGDNETCRAVPGIESIYWLICPWQTQTFASFPPSAAQWREVAMTVACCLHFGVDCDVV